MRMAGLICSTAAFRSGRGRSKASIHESVAPGSPSGPQSRLADSSGLSASELSALTDETSRQCAYGAAIEVICPLANSATVEPLVALA